MTIQYVDQPQILDALVEDCRHADVIALDTEFERSSTYFARPALLQFRIAERIWLLDPVAVPDLDNLGDALSHSTPLKIMHSASEDLAVLELATGHAIKGLFDTQLAAAFAGHGFGLGYHALVNRLLGTNVNKDQTRSNWLQRPLSAAQLAYAAADVEHLQPMYQRLSDEVNQLERRDWLDEETQTLIARASGYDIERDFVRLAARVNADDDARGRLHALCQWREDQARQLDRPRKHIVDDPLMVEMAAESPSSRTELEALPAWRTHRGRVGARALLDAIEQTRTAASLALPAECEDLTPHKATLNKLKQVVAKVSASIEIEPAMLAPRRVLEKVVVHCVLLQRQGLPDELHGWRGRLLEAPIHECLRNG